MDKRHAPLNDWLHMALRPLLKRILPSDERYTLIFDKFEVLMALGYGHLFSKAGDIYWAPPGAYGYRSDNRARVLQEFEDSILQLGDSSPFVKCGLFGNTAAQCKESLSAFVGFAGQIGRTWW